DFERHALTVAYTVPILWWNRIVGALAVEIRLAGEEVLVPTLASPVVCFHVLDEHERPGPEHVRLREEWILLEPGGAVNAVPGRGEVRQHGRVRPLQMKEDGRRIGRIDPGDRGVVGLSYRKDASRRVDDAVVTCFH